jgi:tol-pal system protein YbgF
MTQKIFASLLAGALVLAAAAPARAANKEHQQLMAEIRMLQEQQQQLQQMIGSLTDALKAVSTKLDDQAAANRKALADQKVTIDALGTDMRAIRERADDTNVRVGTLREEIDALRTSVTALSQTAAPQPAPVDPNVAPTTSTPAAVPPPAPSTAGLSPTRMYQEAFADYTAGQYTVAVAGLEQFIRAFPRSEMADDAQFFIGEANYVQNKFADAITAYNAVIQNYPTGDQVPLALYKRGLAQRQLGQNDAARASWELVIQKFPDSDGARLAKQRLDALGTAAPAR